MSETLKPREIFFAQLKAAVSVLSAAEFAQQDSVVADSEDEAVNNVFPTIAFVDTTDENNFKIYINGDLVPEEFRKYIIEHECWEAYLWQHSRRSVYDVAIEDAQLPESEQKRYFHRQAIKHELILAIRDNVLDQYCGWVDEYYTNLLLLQTDEVGKHIVESMYNMRLEVLQQVLSRTKKTQD